MARSIEDKLKYNRKNETPFGTGYIFGVNIYREYKNLSSANKKIVKQLIEAARLNANRGESYDKGVMCGVRDAANERKNRK